MKFTFNIKITNTSNQQLEGRLEFEPTDYSLVDLRTSMDKKIFEYIDVYPGASTKWFRTEVDVPSLDENTLRTDIHFAGSSIELNIEKPVRMHAAFPFRVNETGNQYAIIKFGGEDSITATFNKSEAEDPMGRIENAWTRKY